MGPAQQPAGSQPADLFSAPIALHLPKGFYKSSIGGGVALSPLHARRLFFLLHPEAFKKGSAQLVFSKFEVGMLALPKLLSFAVVFSETKSPPVRRGGGVPPPSEPRLGRLSRSTAGSGPPVCLVRGDALSIAAVYQASEPVGRPRRDLSPPSPLLPFEGSATSPTPMFG